MPVIGGMTNENKNSQKEDKNVINNEINNLNQIDYINSPIIQKEKDNSIRNNTLFNQKNIKYKINSSHIENELKSIKTKLYEMEKNINDFKKDTNNSLSSLSNENNNIEKFSNKILLLKEEYQNNINELKNDFNQKIKSLNDLIQNLSDINDENEKTMNLTKSQNMTLVSKLDIINTKINEYISKSEFEKYKNKI